MPEDTNRKASPFSGPLFQNIFASGVAILIGLYATFIPFITNPRFFFNDDEQNQHYPYFIDIGQHLRHHQWPGITLSTLYGGNLIDDWQYELFNPFSLLIFWILCPIQNLLIYGLTLFGIYLPLFSLGAFWLGRAFGLSRILSLALAACLVTNNFLQYMYCDSWSMGIVSLTWFTWTWALLEQYRRGGQSLVLGALACSIYLTITSGWPHTILILGVLMLGYIAELSIVQHKVARALKLFLTNFGALLATAPYLLPALLSFSWMSRPSGIHSSGLFMPDLGSVLNLSSIFLFPRIHLYIHEYPSFPMMYLAWFILPLLPLLSWQTAVEALKNQWGIIAVALVSLIMLFGPENVGPIRYPMRFLPYLHFAFLITFFLVITRPDIFRISKRRLAGVFVILFFQFSTSFSVRPDSLYLQLMSSALEVILVCMAARFIYLRNLTGLGSLLLIGTLIIFWVTHFVSRKNMDLTDFQPPSQNNTALPTVAQPFSGYQIYMGPLVYDNTKEISVAAEGIFSSLSTVNGYCALGHAGLRPGMFGYNWFEMRDTSGIDFLLAREPTTNRSRLSLMRVNRLLICNDYFDHARPLLGKDWVETSKGTYSIVLDSTAPNHSPTTLSFASDGIMTRPLPEVTGEREQLQIIANPKGGELVFARLYWPGYEASLDGHPVPVSPLDKIFVKVDLPPGSLGELTLKFVPPGWTLGLILAVVGTALCCVTVVINRRGTAMEAS